MPSGLSKRFATKLIRRLAIAGFFATWAAIHVAKMHRTAAARLVTPEASARVNQRMLPTIDVVKLGADPTGRQDSAPAFRAALASDRLITVPKGVYLFSSNETSPCCAFDPPAVLGRRLHDFVIDGHGATIVIGDKIALSSAIHIDQSYDFIIRGLTIRGNRTDLRAEQENAAFALTSDVRFLVEGIQIPGGFNANGTAIAGDWLVDGEFRDITALNVGHCIDVAYLLRVRFTRIIGTGAGSEGSNSPGQTCISVIEDPPNSAQNHTGVSYSSSANITVTGVDERNFNTGALLASGRGYLLSGNRWHDNIGSGSTRGVGVLIRTGRTPGTGVPPGEVKIEGDQFYRNSSGQGIAEVAQ